MLPADPQWSWRVYSHWPRWWQREALTLSTEKPFPHHSQYQIGGEIRGRQVHASSKSKWCGGGAGPKRSVRLACRKKEVVEMWTHSNHIKVWEVDWSFWKSTGPFHTKNWYWPRGTKKLPLFLVAWCSGLGQCTDWPVISMNHMALTAMWPMSFRRESLSLSVTS